VIIFIKKFLDTWRNEKWPIHPKAFARNASNC